MDIGKVMPDGDLAAMARFLRARSAGHSPGYDIVIYARPRVWIAMADEIERLQAQVMALEAARDAYDRGHFCGQRQGPGAILHD